MTPHPALRSWWLQLLAAVLVTFLATQLSRGQDAAALALVKQAAKLHEAGRDAEAEEPLFQALRLIASTYGAESEETIEILSFLAQTYQARGLHDLSADVRERVLTLAKRIYPEGSAERGEPIYMLGVSRIVQGRYADAVLHLEEARSSFAASLGAEHPAVAMVLQDLGLLALVQYRFEDAEAYITTAITRFERMNPPDTRLVALALHNLALVFQEQGRYDEVEPIYLRVLELRTHGSGWDELAAAVTLNNLGSLHRTRGEYEQADRRLTAALSIRRQKRGPIHSETLQTITNLANLRLAQGRHAEAAKLHNEVLFARRVAPEVNHLEIAISLNDLGLVHLAQGQHAHAAEVLAEALAIREALLEADNPVIARSLSNLAQLAVQQKVWDRAADAYRRSAAIFIRRILHRQGQMLISGRETDREEIVHHHRVFGGFIAVADRLGRGDAARRVGLAKETFLIAQWMQDTEAAGALSRMAARTAATDSELSRLIRNRQDLLDRQDALRKALVSAMAIPASQRRSESEEDWRREIATIGRRIGEIDERLRRDFPDYPAIAHPEPLEVAAVQELLAPNEALYSLAQLDDAVFAWAVTREGLRWRKLDIDTKTLTDHVTALRCGLDSMPWTQDRGLERKAEGPRGRCLDLLGREPLVEGGRRVLPFDFARSHELYKTLFGPFEDMIEGRHLLLVSAGSLAGLPFQIFVSRAPDPSLSGYRAYEDAAWMIREHALTVLPSVTSLKALRRNAGRSKGAIPFAGIANPLLHGPTGTDQRAWTRQECPKAAPARLDRLVGFAGLRDGIADLQPNGKTDVAKVRGQYPLPETTDEVCQVRDSLGGGEVLLGAKATEGQLKVLSGKGELRGFRVLHFATHGLLAGETEKLSRLRVEPALILTPPETASENDDGLLTASEVAQLDLDADFVVLSACNTAAGSGDTDSRALSGLARAFLYAGSRGLLVSHWYVDSQAAVDLVTASFMAGVDKRAEALQQAMLSEIAKGGYRAHPAYWAPFVLVGSGRMAF